MSSVPLIFDRALARLRLARAIACAPAAFLLERAAEDLADRLAPVQRPFADSLDFGTPGPQAADLLALRPTTASVTRIGEAAGAGARTIVDDLENPGLPEAAYDLAVSLLALHTVNDLPGVFAQIRRALRPDGLFIAAIPGGETLHELRAALMEAELETTGGASPRVAPFADVRSLGQLLQRAGFALPVADSEALTVRYSSALNLMRDLRAMGATNILADRAQKPLTRATLARALDIYTERYSDPDGKVRATFDIIWVSGWAPHESQQKPLRPGAAKMRFADALKPASYMTTPEDEPKP